MNEFNNHLTGAEKQIKAAADYDDFYKIKQNLFNNFKLAFNAELELNKKALMKKQFMEFMIKHSGCADDYELLDKIEDDLIANGIITIEELLNFKGNKIYGRWS